MIVKEKINNTALSYIEKLILPSEPISPKWNRENILFSKPARWNYIDNCIIKAILSLYEINGDERLLRYSMRFIDFYIRENGDIPTINPLDFNLDNINGGKNLLTLYRITGIERYRNAYEFLYNGQLKKQPRLKCGNFFHKAIYPNQIWLDGVYMALPFLAEYGLTTNHKEILEDVQNQIRNIREIMRDKKTGLYFHGYDETRSMNWADPETGLSNEFWLRSMGWFCAALTDLCEITASSHELNKLCRITLNELLYSLSAYIDDTDMMMQLPVRNDLEHNYPETSGTLLFSYSALKSYRLGICCDAIKVFGEKTVKSVTDNYIITSPGAIPVLKNICLVAGLGGPEKRNGSSGYYLSEPIVENDAKGIAPFLMTYTEVLRTS